jgi:hypothetical protein
VSETRSILFALCLLLSAAAWAEDMPNPAPFLGDAVYKGVVGKALDAVPMDPEQRVVLQRTNAVIGNTMTARSLSIWVIGLTHPILLIGGLVWGLYAAANIQVDTSRSISYASLLKATGSVEVAPNPLAFLKGSLPGEEPRVVPGSEVLW